MPIKFTVTTWELKNLCDHLEKMKTANITKEQVIDVIIGHLRSVIKKQSISFWNKWRYSDLFKKKDI